MFKNSPKIKVGLIGLGYWGPNYVRLISENSHTELVWACDIDSNKFFKVKEKYPNLEIKFINDFEKNLNQVDAVILTTPWETHFQIASLCLEKEKHVLVEKPLTKTISEARQLCKLAREKKKVLFVDHIFKYNPAVKELRKLIQTSQLGEILYLTGEFLALGPIRQDANALWDLGIHFIYTAMFLLDATPISVSVCGSDYLLRDIEDVCFIRMDFKNGIKVNISASWLFPEKIRKLVVVGNKAMAVFDDVKPEGKLYLYKKGASYIDEDTPYLLWDEGIKPVEVQPSEPLKEAFNEFVQAIIQKRQPLTNGEDGRKIIKIMTACQKSLKMGGKEVLLR